MMNWYSEYKQEELKRNRQYEVSLVKALKNSYEGIEEIKLSNPDYDWIPENWSCDIQLKYQDGESVKFGASYDKETVSEGGMYRELNNSQLDYLEKHKGITTNKVIVIYSNGEKGEQ